MTEGDVFITRRQAEALIEDRITQYLTKGNIPSSLIEGRHIASLSADKLAAGTISAAVSIGTGNISLDGVNDRILISDGTNNRILLDSTGAFKISASGNDVLTAADANLLIKVGDTIHIKLGEFAYALHPGPRQWTTNDSWTNINSTEFEIDGDSYAFTSVYFSVLGCVETSGRTASYRIYNITDSAVVTDSTISTTAVSSEAEGWVNAETIVSSALTFASGTKRYRLQFMQSVAGGGGDSTQFFKGELFYAQV